jgi:holo-[acyl-carrier protein] synthase
MKGVGTDIVNVARLRRSLGRGTAFAEEVFSDEERRYCDAQARPAQHYAARFAAKEAFLKALGLGLFAGVALRDVEVRRADGGAPCLSLGPSAAAALARSGGGAPLLSLSHDGDVAIAFVVVP